LTGNYSQSTTESEYIIEMPMIGISKDNLTVSVEDNVLNVKGKTDSKSLYVKDVSQSWTLNKDCNLEAISAVLENGLLTLKIPKIKPTKKTVSVKVS
jgi:HSP20 family molecular chaperone IbpA